MNGANRKWSGLSWAYSSRRYKSYLWMCLSRWKASDGKELHSALTTWKQLWILWCQSSLLTTVSTLFFYLFFLTQPIRWHLQNRKEIHLTYPGQEMMAGEWVQPSPTTIFNFLPNLFASLHAPETTLLPLQQRLLAVLWDTQVCSASEFAWSFLGPASYLSSYLCRMLQPKWWNHLLKLLCGQILLLFFLRRCHMLHLNWMIKTLFLSALCFGHLFSVRPGYIPVFFVLFCSHISIAMKKKPTEAQWKPHG